MGILLPRAITYSIIAIHVSVNPCARFLFSLSSSAKTASNVSMLKTALITKVVFEISKLPKCYSDTDARFTILFSCLIADLKNGSECCSPTFF